MKISWGVGITITIVVFTIVSLWFMFFALSHDVNIVRDDYYEEELKFQEKIDKIERTNDLKEKLIVLFVEDQIIFKFPPSIKANTIMGNISLYRPSDRNLDLSFPISLDSNGMQLYPTKNLLQGLWKVKTDWKSDTTSYYNNNVIMVN